MMESIKNLREYGHDCCARIDDAIKELADNIEAEVAERYVALPTDADGEVVRIGDFMENLREDLEPQLHHRFKVYGILYRDYGQVCALTEDGYPSISYRANECRHYQPPTVESTLREMLAEIGEGGVYAEDVLLAKYAPRLRLAEVAE